jgi:metal-responsive CopG/Arc/MetJ family transcriptional regulator
MSNSRTISLRIPDDLLSKIDRLAEERYKSHKGTPNRSLVILDAITAYCDALYDTESDNEFAASSSNVDIKKLQELEKTVFLVSQDIEWIKQSLIALHDSVNNPLKPDIEPKQDELAKDSSQHIDQGDLPLFPSPNLSEKIEIHASLLAKRLGLSLAILNNLKSQYKRDFSGLSGVLKDPDGIKWMGRSGKNVYYPHKETSSDLLDRLCDWIEKNKD